MILVTISILFLFIIGSEAEDQHLFHFLAFLDYYSNRSEMNSCLACCKNFNSSHMSCFMGFSSPLYYCLQICPMAEIFINKTQEAPILSCLFFNFSFFLFSSSPPLIKFSDKIIPSHDLVASVCYLSETLCSFIPSATVIITLLIF